MELAILNKGTQKNLDYEKLILFSVNIFLKMSLNRTAILFFKSLTLFSSCISIKSLLPIDCVFCV